MIDKNKWLIVLILNILTFGLYTFYIGKKLDVYDDSAWYNRWYLWALGFLFGIIPGIVMLFIFYIKVGCMVSKKLMVPLEQYYSYPYIWILSFIVPVLGWAIFIVMIVYVHSWYCLYLKRGYGDYR